MSKSQSCAASSRNPSRTSPPSLGRRFLGPVLLGVALLGTAAGASAPSPAAAQTPGANPQAEKLNDEGKELYSNRDYGAAVQKFEAAIALSADARYYFNLCSAYDKMNELQKALDACDEVFTHGARDELQQKTGKKAALIRQRMRQQAAQQPPGPGPGPGPDGQPTGPGPDGQPTGPGPDGQPAGPGPGPSGQPSGGPQPAGYTPPGGGTTYYPPPDAGEEDPSPGTSYTWAVGADFGVGRRLSLGDDGFADMGFHIKGFVDWLIARDKGIGLQFFIDFSSFPSGEFDGIGDRQLTMADVGAQGYWHFKLGRKLYLTPQAGLGLSLMSPYTYDDSSSFLALNARGSVSLQILLGNGKHVITITPVAVNYYTGASAGDSGYDPADFGLDEGGATVFAGVSYMTRFTTPFMGGFKLE